MSLSFKNDGVNVHRYLYDFATDAGAVGSVILSNKSGQAAVPVGAVVKSVTARVLTALTSGGAATLEWGNGDDPDGYSGAAAAVAGFTANAIFNEQAGAGALLWDNANDSEIRLFIDDATTGQVKFTINTAALTAGKIEFLVEYYLPS